MKSFKQSSTKSQRSKSPTKGRLPKPVTLAQARRQLEHSKGNLAMVELALACGPAFAYREIAFCIGVVVDRLLKRKQTPAVEVEISRLASEYMALPAEIALEAL